MPSESLEEFLLGKHLRGSAATADRVRSTRPISGHDRSDETCLRFAAYLGKSRSQRLNERLAALPARWLPSGRSWRRQNEEMDELTPPH